MPYGVMSCSQFIKILDAEKLFSMHAVSVYFKVDFKLYLTAIQCK